MEEKPKPEKWKLILESPNFRVTLFTHTSSILDTYSASDSEEITQDLKTDQAG